MKFLFLSSRFLPCIQIELKKIFTPLETGSITSQHTQHKFFFFHNQTQEGMGEKKRKQKDSLKTGPRSTLLNKTCFFCSKQNMHIMITYIDLSFCYMECSHSSLVIFPVDVSIIFHFLEQLWSFTVNQAFLRSYLFSLFRCIEHSYGDSVSL